MEPFGESEGVLGVFTTLGTMLEQSRGGKGSCRVTGLSPAMV